MKRLLFLTLTMAILCIASLTNAEDQYEVHLRDGKIIKGVIITESANVITIKGYNEENGFPITIPCPDIQYIQRIQSGNSNQITQNKPNTTVKGDDIVFRDFLWSDTPEITTRKIKNIDGYGDLMISAITNKVRGLGNVHLIENIIELDRVIKELKGCNSDSIIHYQSDIDPRKDSIAQGINFFFSIHDDTLLYYFLYIQRNATTEVSEILNEKYGNGDNIVGDWIKWENEGVSLLFSPQRGQIIYINNNNLKMVPLQCREADKNKQTKKKGNAAKQF